MKCTKLRKKGWVIIEDIELENEKRRLECFGIYPKKKMFWSSVKVSGYHLVEIDDRILAVPNRICEGIEV